MVATEYNNYGALELVFNRSEPRHKSFPQSHQNNDDLKWPRNYSSTHTPKLGRASGGTNTILSSQQLLPQLKNFLTPAEKAGTEN